MEDMRKLVQMVAVVDIDPTLALYRPIQQKWVSSIEVLSEAPKEPRCKALSLAPHLWLIVNYNEKNKLPIYDLEFLVKPLPEWHAIKMPPSFYEKYALSLCYRTDSFDDSQPLTDIDILSKKLNEDKEVFMVPSGFKILSTNPLPSTYIILKRMKSILEQTFKSILLQKYPTHHPLINTSLLPLFCFPQGIRLSRQMRGLINYNFVNTTETGERIYITCLSFRECLPPAYRAKLQFESNEQIYYEKALCILSKFRFTDEFVDILKHFYRLSISKSDVPFYKLSKHFSRRWCAHVRVMGQVIRTVVAKLTSDQTTLTPQCQYNCLHLEQCAMYCIFKFLPLTAIINIFEAILIEKKVLFVSQSKTVLGYAVEAFLTLIYPFQWQHVLIPILPLTEREYLNAPLPLIAGINPILIDPNIEPDSLIVQLDTGQVLNDQDLPPLPEKMEKLLRKKLQPFQIYDDVAVKEFLQNPQSTYIFKMQAVDHPHFHSNFIRDIFFDFMLVLMKNYKKFEIANHKLQTYVSEVFKVQQFLSDLGMAKAGSFGYRLTEGLLFTSYLQRRSNDPKEPVFLFFDQCLDRKKNKKQTNFFITPQNNKFTVFLQPEAEGKKEIYFYDRFPSILDAVEEEIVQISIVENAYNDQEELISFIQQECEINSQFYQEFQGNDDLQDKVKRLLLNSNKKQYYQKQKATQYQILNTSALSRNKADKTQCLNFFQQLYLKQRNSIEQVMEQLTNWEGSENKNIFLRIDKKKYYKKKLTKQQYEIDQNGLIGVYEQCDKKTLIYELLIKGENKIMICNVISYQKTSIQNPRNSRRNINLQVYISDYKIRFLVNSLIEKQPFKMFSFMLNQIKNKGNKRWSIEDIFLLRQVLNNSHRDAI